MTTTSTARPARCRNCGSADVVWAKSVKTGRFYLADVVTSKCAGVTASTRPHFRSCTAQNAERAEQVADIQAARNAERVAFQVWNGSQYIDTRTGQKWSVR